MDMTYTQRITLDLETQSLYRFVNAKQGDDGSRFLLISLEAQGEPLLIPEDATVQFRCLKPDGYACINPATLTEDGSILVELTQQVLAVPGAVLSDVCVEGPEGEILSSALFVIRVEAVPGGSVVASSNEFLELLAVLDRSDSMLGDYESALAQLEGIQGQTLQAMQQTVDAKENAESAEVNARQSADEARAAGDLAETASEAAQDAAQRAQESADSVDAQLIHARIDGKADNLFYDESSNMLYLLSDGQIIGTGIQVATGTGGGGGGSLYTVSLQNLLPSRFLTVADGGEVVLHFTYSSVDAQGEGDGAGVATLTVNSVKKAVFQLPQGEHTLEITKYLSTGASSVKLSVENSEGVVKTLSFTVTVVALSLTTTFDELGTYSGEVTFAYTVTGTGNKTVYFFMDGVSLGSTEVLSSGRSQSFAIPSQSGGGHLFSAYAEVEVDGVTVSSNQIALGMIWLDGLGIQPGIAVPFNVISAVQGENLIIPYMVYDPTAETATVGLTVYDAAGEVYDSRELTVDRSAQTWTVSDYPAGNIRFVISCGESSKEILAEVEQLQFPLEIARDGLVLEFTAEGRSNAEAVPEKWNYGEISASFEGFGWGEADGWLSDENGQNLLRFLPGNRMTLPYFPFADDARETGFTLEADLATRDVRDYETVILSCLSGGRGFRIASQFADLTSEQMSVSMMFKEDSRIRVAFVVEQKNQNRLVYIYINGILCGASQYASDDDFSQNEAVGLTVGADSCGLDLYKIRFYRKALTRGELLDNYICDLPTLAQRQKALTRNDIFGDNEEVMVDKLPQDLPYMIISCKELPKYKGDKKYDGVITFVDPASSTKSFTAQQVQLDVQGTSSQGYPVKNYKFKASNGFVIKNEQSDHYCLMDGTVPTNTFCLKADYASSESANNVRLVSLYEDNCPYRTPAQQNDERVRQGIAGRPVALFWQNSASGEISLLGKYNFNHDKSTGEVFGFTDAYPNAQSWEFLNNTSDRVIFKKSDYSSGWTQDFEARYPEGCTDYSKLKRVTDWVVSTDRDGVTSAEEKQQRLDTFKAEFEEYFVKDAMLFYYMFTEVFLMVDSRAKNMFLTTFDGTHWMCLPYDFDTSLGINNEGMLAFSYGLEDTDSINGALVYNGQNSVLWKNVRDAFGNEIQEMYQTLRSGGAFSYDVVKKAFEEHQNLWPEALWNEDAYLKYLQPLLNKGENYLYMLQGSKKSQRDWWLFNGFRYRDSKYLTGDAKDQFINLRCYALGDITVTPYADIYPAIKYGSYTVQKRGQRNVPCKLENPMDNLNDTEVYIYSADRLSSVGDLSTMQVGKADFSKALKLQQIILGNGNANYQNLNLTELSVGNNELLTLLDVQNCGALSQSVDMSGCTALETVKAFGSAITGLNLPKGGHLRNLELPATIANFTVINQRYFESVSFEGLDALTTLRVENTPNIAVESIVLGAANLSRVRLIDISWTAQNADTLMQMIEKLALCKGMDASGANAAAAVLTGQVAVDDITDQQLVRIHDLFPELTVKVNGEAKLYIRYLDHDGTLLYTTHVAAGDAAIDPVALGHISAPEREAEGDYGYVFCGWSQLPEAVNENCTIIARYDVAYAVRFYDDYSDSRALIHTQWIAEGGDATDPVAGGLISVPTKSSTTEYSYSYSGWDVPLTNITAPREITATYTQKARTYSVRWYIGNTLKYTKMVAFGAEAVYPGSEPVDPDGVNAFRGWSVTISGSTFFTESTFVVNGSAKCTAVFGEA